MNWKEEYKKKIVSPEDAVKLVKSGDSVFINLGGEPRSTLDALAKRAPELRNVKLSCSWLHDHPWFHPGMEESFDVRATFVTRVTRQAIKESRVGWIPWLPGLGDRDRCLETERGGVQQHSDVACVSVTPPDEKGYCSFGNQVWCAPNAVRTAKTSIAEINDKLPFTYGDNVHVSQISCFVQPQKDTATVSVPGSEWTSSNIEEFNVAQVIGAMAADLIKDGDTVQVGIGVPSEASMGFLESKNDLGIDTEVIYPAVIDLMKKGVINCKNKNINKNKVLATSAWIVAGHPLEKATIEFLNKNKSFAFYDFSTMTNVPRIASNNNMVTINTLLGIDLLGQAMVDFLGTKPIAGQGGQMEYTIGSHYSKGGRSVACLVSTARGGSISRIVPQFEAGTGIGIPMGYVDYLVTEYGTVNLEYKTQKERAEAIISVAHPDFREELTKAAKSMF